MKQLEKIKVKDISEAIDLATDFKELYKMNQFQLQEIAKNENESFVKRKFIKLISSDDDKLSLEAIKYLHSIVNAENVEFDKITITKNANGIDLSDNQEKIYKSLYKSNNGDMMTSGDIELLKILAINIDHYNNMKLINEHTGFKMKFKNGAQQVRPEVTVMRDCLKNIQNTMQMLGITTLGRIKNGIDIKIENNDPLIDLI